MELNFLLKALDAAAVGAFVTGPGRHNRVDHIRIHPDHRLYSR